MVREELGETLNEAGYEVVSAPNATKAIAELEKDAERFRAVVTDINMGEELSGWDVGRRARELVPSMPIVYVSGTDTSEWAAKGVPQSLVVAKPFATMQLITAISTLLTQSDTSLPPRAT